MHTQVLVLDQIMPAALQWMLLIIPQQELIDQQRMQTQRFKTWRGISSALGCHSCCTRLKRTHQIGSGTDDVPARGGIIEPSLLEALSVAIKAATARLLDGLVHGVEKKLFSHLNENTLLGSLHDGLPPVLLIRRVDSMPSRLAFLDPKTFYLLRWLLL